MLKLMLRLPLPGIQVSDIDSTNVQVTISTETGIFTGIDTILYEVTGSFSNSLTIRVKSSSNKCSFTESKIPRS